jgi:pimeloyl-ACP methyl ester carboxylesterase
VTSATLIEPTAVRWLEVDLPGRGTTYACDLAGPDPDAPTVVLLHGLMATGALNWGPYLDALADSFRVVALDHRGHGRGITDGPFTLEDCADDAVALLDVLGIDRAIFAGYSMGGPIAQLVWHRHPARVRALVLCATAADFHGTPWRRLGLIAAATAERFVSAALPRPVRVQSQRSVIGSLVADPVLRQEVLEALGRHDETAIRAAARAVQTFSSRGWIGDVDVPAVVVLTERDHVVTPEQQWDLADRLPDALVVRVDANHMVARNDPERFSVALDAACVLAAERSAPPVARRPRRRRWRGWWSRRRNRA